MTTIFRVRVETVEGPRLTLDVDHVHRSDWDRDLVPSPTQALHFLREPMIRGFDRPGGRELRCWESAAWAATFPLYPELGGRDFTDEPWNRANVGRFIACVGVTDRLNHTEMWNDTEDGRWYFPREVEPGAVDTPTALHHVVATDPRWLAQLAPGMEWDSTAYAHDEPIAVDPGWRTPEVLSLAWRLADSGDLSALPILTDALQEAGCANERLLGHLRDSCPHARGCWAVAAFLGNGFDPRVFDPAAVPRVDVDVWPVVEPWADEDEVETDRPVMTSSSTRPEDIAALLAALRPATQAERRSGWGWGLIRFTHAVSEPTELVLVPMKDPNWCAVRAAGGEYNVERSAFAAALGRFGVELPAG